MARKRYIHYNYKHIGWSVVSVGMLSCGGGYPNQDQGYLKMTGPTKVRLETPKASPIEFPLPPLFLGQKDLVEEDSNDVSGTVSTNAVPPKREEHYSINSHPSEPVPHQPLVIQQNNIRQKPFNQLAEEYLPPGYLDVLDDPIEKNEVGLQELLRMLTEDQNPLQYGPAEPAPNDVPAPASGDSVPPTDPVIPKEPPVESEPSS